MISEVKDSGMTRANLTSSETVEPESHQLPLTFGVELEFILIVKKILEEDDEWLRRPDSPQISSLKKRKHSESDELERYHPACGHTVRILRRAGCPATMSLPHFRRKLDHESWSVTSDVTLFAGPNSKFSDQLPDRINPHETLRWSGEGVELRSRKLNVPPPEQRASSHRSLREVEKYVTALRGKANDPFGSFVNETCGLHVHVGQDPKRSLDGTACLPLDVLQHLSYILIQYEHILTSLHPMGRRGYYGTTTMNMVGSNLVGVRESRHVCDKVPLSLLQAIENKIFDPDQSVERLSALMGRTLRAKAVEFESPKYKFVNFSYTSGRLPHKPQTIEFRQHAGTLNFEHISRWICLVSALVRTAERKAQQSKPATPVTPLTPKSALEIHMALPGPRRQGNKYKMKCENQYLNMMAFFDLLNLDRSAIDYWLGRYSKYNPDQVAGPHCATTNQCTLCVEEAREAKAEAVRRAQVDEMSFIWGVDYGSSDSS